MAPLPTINNVFRVVLLWNTNTGITPRNVFHVHANGADEGDVKDTIQSNAVDHMFSPMSGAYDCPQIGVTKLDGSSAQQIFNITSGTFLGGHSGSDAIPQACALLSLHTAQRGPRGRGRMYIGPIVEAAQANGVLNTTDGADMDVAWSDFISAMDTDNMPMVVASYVHADFHLLTSINIDSLVATQRRRLDQLR